MSHATNPAGASSIMPIAPAAAPPDTPSTYGSASGLRSSTCISAPASASNPPPANADNARGNRNIQISSSIADDDMQPVLPHNAETASEAIPKDARQNRIVNARLTLSSEIHPCGYFQLTAGIRIYSVAAGTKRIGEITSVGKIGSRNCILPCTCAYRITGIQRREGRDTRRTGIGEIPPE